jgi:hypothetical protein
MSPVAPGAQPPSDPAAAGADGPAAAAAGSHDFSVQKELHRQIRNDPDYDDWEYGTEPLPHESWRSATPPPTPSKEATAPAAGSPPPAASSAADPGAGLT